MEPETNLSPNDNQTGKHPVFCITSVSKYLALALFVILPFLGGYVGYVSAPEKVVEVETVIEKGVEAEPQEKEGHSNTIINQSMGFWRVMVDDGNYLKVVAPEIVSGESKIEVSTPRGWWISHSESNDSTNSNTIKSINFTDPEHPGREGTDTPLAYISFSFGQNNESCNDVFAFKDSGNSNINDDLSTSLTSVHDTGWNKGWADLPSRVLCIESDEEYGEVIEVQLYPITEDNKNMFDTLIKEMVLK